MRLSCMINIYVNYKLVLLQILEIIVYTANGSAHIDHGASDMHVVNLPVGCNKCAQRIQACMRAFAPNMR